MDTRQAYNIWSEQYDTNENKTRDLEAKVLRAALSQINFSNCLEIGCGTGKNSVWLIEQCDHLTGADLSEEMLAKARQKINSDKVEFKQVDITNDWSFADRQYDLVTFSLVLEHIEDLNHIFKETARVLQSGGHVYLGELHPFKQYNGSKARFDTAEGQQVVQCYNHNISEFLLLSKKHGLSLIDINEAFDGDNKESMPRILMLLFKK